MNARTNQKTKFDYIFAGQFKAVPHVLWLDDNGQPQVQSLEDWQASIDPYRNGQKVHVSEIEQARQTYQDTIKKLKAGKLKGIRVVDQYTVVRKKVPIENMRQARKLDDQRVGGSLWTGFHFITQGNIEVPFGQGSVAKMRLALSGQMQRWQRILDKASTPIFQPYDATEELKLDAEERNQTIQNRASWDLRDEVRHKKEAENRKARKAERKKAKSKKKLARKLANEIRNFPAPRISGV